MNIFSELQRMAIVAYRVDELTQSVSKLSDRTRRENEALKTELAQINNRLTRLEAHLEISEKYTLTQKN